MAGEATRGDVRSAAEAERLVLDVLGRHAESLLRVARHHSLCADDAQDAYQRGTEIFLRHARSLEAEGAHKWLHTVVKHEAMRVRAQRARHVAGEEVDLDAHESGRLPTPDEHVASFDRMTRAAEALQRLKPQELRALWLRAQGHSYQEIAELCDWTYTKVNRCITEGRRSFLDRYAEIGTGAECARWEGVLSRMVDGEATPQDLALARPHLRNCPACRARVRALREAAVGLGALLPLSQAAAAPDHGGLLARVYEVVAGPIHERLMLGAARLQTGVEVALPGKVAMVAASAAAVGGGVAVERAVTTPGRPAVVREAPARAAAWTPPAGFAQHVAAREPVASPPSALRAGPTAGPPRREAARRTTRSEFGLAGSRARDASTSRRTAEREFAGAEPSPAPVPAPTTSASVATASPEPAASPAPAAPPARAERTAAAEFGG